MVWNLKYKSMGSRQAGEEQLGRESKTEVMGQSVLQQGHAPENLSAVLGCLAWGVKMGRMALDTAGKQAEGSSQRPAMLC